jgi:hypothetical protein
MSSEPAQKSNRRAEECSCWLRCILDLQKFLAQQPPPTWCLCTPLPWQRREWRTGCQATGQLWGAESEPKDRNTHTIPLCSIFTPAWSALLLFCVEGFCFSHRKEQRACAMEACYHATLNSIQSYHACGVCTCGKFRENRLFFSSASVLFLLLMHGVCMQIRLDRLQRKV